MKTIRFGILGTAGIARKNWRAIRDSGHAIVAAVASRDLERSRRFIQECQAGAAFEAPVKALGSYEELLASDLVDAVYIPLPTGLRKEWVLRSAKAGKHVVCEKPCAVNSDDLTEMLAACRRHRVQFMDGVMFMHNPRLARMRRVLDDGASVGQIKRIMSMFSFPGDREFLRANIRLHSGLEPAGCLGDLGWYCLRLSLWTMNWQLPSEVSGSIVSQYGCGGSPSPVPTDFSGELIFPGGVSSGFFCSFLTAHQQWAQVSGAKGCLRLPDFVHSDSEHEPAFEVNKTAVRVRCCDCKTRHSKSRAMAQDAIMFRAFTKQIQSGKLNAEWPMMALQTQRVMDACLESARREGRYIRTE